MQTIYSIRCQGANVRCECDCNRRRRDGVANYVIDAAQNVSVIGARHVAYSSSNVAVVM
jgi:hypothetical protein